MTTAKIIISTDIPHALVHTFEEARLLVESVVAESRRCSAVLNDTDLFPRSAMGLVSDAVKFSVEYRKASVAFDRAFARERSINTWYVKTFPKEIRTYRDAQRQAKLGMLAVVAPELNMTTTEESK